MKGAYLVLAVSLLAFQTANGGELYRWVDKAGEVHYGDKPVEDADRLKFSDKPPSTAEASGDAASGVGSADIPYEARQASKHFPVTLYVIKECDDTCKHAKQYLKKRRIPYTENVLKTQEEFDAFRKQSGMAGVPALSVGRNWLGGFVESQWKSELDAAGYPD